VILNTESPLAAGIFFAADCMAAPWGFLAKAQGRKEMAPQWEYNFAGKAGRKANT